MTRAHALASCCRTAILSLAVLVMPLPARAQTAATPAGAPARPRSPCPADANRHRFDFWIGEWNVETKDGKPAGRSSIQAISGGCGLLENWTDTNGGTGKSINAYNPTLGTWQQFWVGEFGAVTEYRESEWRGDTLSFRATSRANGKSLSLRLTFNPLGDGSVRQLGEQSADSGRTWTPTYEFFYRRRTR
jgi:hypothetical protein